MKVEDALIAMRCIDEQNDGSEARAAIVATLHQKLMEDPENFWDTFFETLNALQDDPFRELAEQMLRSGAVHGLTTIADARNMLADYYAPSTLPPQARQ